MRSARRLRALAVWVLLAAGFYAALHFYAAGQLYWPMRYPAGYWQAQAGLEARDVWLRASDGVRIHAWWKAAREARVATLFLHGNGGNLTHRADHLREIAAAGSDVLILDYRGYGRSDGSPSERGLYADADAGYSYLLRTGKPVVVHGESLGAAVAVDLAVRRPAAGVVLEAPFTSVRDMAGLALPVLGPLAIWGYDNQAKIGRLRAPLLIVHGDRDSLVPLRFGQRLYAAASPPKWLWVVPGAGHNDILDAAGSAYRERLRRFYDEIAPAAVAQPTVPVSR
jgi:pimeloyl-ACP methyl ester carboxylesterase